ncbi:sodium-dependent bicarbonate transport family permease [Kiloniella sp. b19]|uniref:sodium-dependent bicarbonate transport family permease n=1 Tax=Kiloniella sp. GXU_MW_B19 TaxID=3141326 RepID=UPI0031DE2F60
MDLSLAVQNLVSPPVLFFALGVFAALVRSELAIPQAVAKGMSLYLMLAIGFKGGVAAIGHGLGLDLLLVIIAATALSFAIPLVAFFFLKTTTKLDQINMAAIAAHYGSISIVTFIAATAALELSGIEYPGIMIAAAAAMEAPAIATALFLAHRGRKKQEEQGAPADNSMLWREVALNASVVLLVGAFLIGMATGEKGYKEISPFITAPFKGVLCLFLLDMGLVAGRELRQVRKTLTPALLGFGIYMPPIGAVIGGLTGALIGLDTGGIMLLSVLAASASYIAVPAAMRIALPEAKPSLYLTLSLAITFPFNLTIGIPAYISLAEALS